MGIMLLSLYVYVVRCTVYVIFPASSSIVIDKLNDEESSIVMRDEHQLACYAI